MTAAGRGRLLLPAAFLGALWLLRAAPPAQAEGFGLDPLRDGLTGGAGLASAVLSEWLFQIRPLQRLGAPDLTGENPVDRLAVLPYSRWLDASADVTQYTVIALPLLLGFFLPLEDDGAALVVYVEVLSWAYFLKDIGKVLFPRYRPFVYAGGSDFSASALAEEDAAFPSGHATMAFAGAAFGVAAFAAYFPSSPWLVPFAVADFGLAALTASLRVVSGMHFLSDVAVGALLGAACGLLIPFAHQRGEAQGGVALSALPGRILVSIPL